MVRFQRPIFAIALLFAAACASTAERTVSGSPATDPRPAIGPYTEADVRFMQGMIRHHAQAVLMAGWATTHGASERLQTLAERIDVSQKDEIALMSRWLRERNETVPDADPSHAMHTMHGHLMPGMLTAEQLTELDAARGTEFERLFLILMIHHHQGAIAMAEELFQSPGGGQEEVIFRFASDVYADQQADIDRMQQMLDTMTTGGS